MVGIGWDMIIERVLRIAWTQEQFISSFDKLVSLDFHIRSFCFFICDREDLIEKLEQFKVEDTFFIGTFND